MGQDICVAYDRQPKTNIMEESEGAAQEDALVEELKFEKAEDVPDKEVKYSGDHLQPQEQEETKDTNQTMESALNTNNT